MAKSVSTNEYRVAFVEKTIGEVGADTDYPMEATLDQIAEIFYRVKRAQFTSIWDSGAMEGFGVTSGAISPRVQGGPVEGVGPSEFVATGYWTMDESFKPCSAASLSYLTESYESVIWPTNATEYGNTFTFRDIDDDELGMWLVEIEGENPIWNKPMPVLKGIGQFHAGTGDYGGLDEQGFRTAFSWYSTSPAGVIDTPTLPVPYLWQDNGFGVVYEYLEVLVEFSGEIAVVKSDPSADLMASSNQFFIGLRFLAYSDFGEAGSNSPSLSSTMARYVIRLDSGDLTCSLRSDFPSFSGDIVQEPTEWWPYAKDSPATPIWNTTTGAKI